MHRAATYAALTATGLLTAGCLNGVQHNDVLIFGTDTKLALDVGANPATAGTPEVTIGYKRQEAVWMPLVLNGKGVDPSTVKPVCQSAAGAACDAAVKDIKYVGAGESGKGSDAYSVFASFGANIKGDPKGPSVGLAQFFATGIAAQRLAANSQVASALTIQPPETGKAMAAASAVQSPEVLAAIAEGTVQANRNKTNAGMLSACQALKSPTKLSTLAGTAPADAGLALLYPGFVRDVDGAKTEAEFAAVVATHRPDFADKIALIITTCGGKPV